jgi:hypothetical protein
MKWTTFEEHQAHANELHEEAQHERLVKTAHEAQRQHRLAGYFERIMSHRHEKRGDR